MILGKSFASDLEKENFSRVSDDFEKWLHEDGDEKTQSAYKSKLDELREFLTPIENRFNNNEHLVKVTKEFEESIHNMEISAVSLPLIVKRVGSIFKWAGSLLRKSLNSFVASIHKWVRSVCCETDKWLKCILNDMLQNCIIPVSTDDIKKKINDLNGSIHGD
ncbi:hypothetical protein ZOSMA_193G00470 [Zostera marina]|uniref:Uncharacterized protein n=1 Tax=Zostera marina TaxID=29655 RepID=A0A0K9PPC2_ZOSMR|nr:hypothetical protein ZOSMA_193G00470 [Zostera marina]